MQVFSACSNAFVSIQWDEVLRCHCELNLVLRKMLRSQMSPQRFEIPHLDADPPRKTCQYTRVCLRPYKTQAIYRSMHGSTRKLNQYQNQKLPADLYLNVTH